ncbi:MAG: transcription/translation regulatory transformer protein RfaH [Gammaproteobacteria bacterium]|nr:transcription/translation regulatory transformer protein RfaH [Gammaproteobacteria bacterium]
MDTHVLESIQQPLTHHHQKDHSGAWYAIQTKPRQERRALEHLQNQGYECLLLQCQRERVRQGARALLDEPLFPRYLFIRLNSVDSNWGPIRSTRGVIGLVCFGGIPAVLPDGVVEGLAQRMIVKEHLFCAGDRVRISDGPFAGLEGIFAQEDGMARVVILLEFMQQQQRLSMPVANIRRLG